MRKNCVKMLAACLAAVVLPALAERALFAGGCFWCMEQAFEEVEGVVSVVSGFTGGALENPTYDGNHEGHLEAVAVEFDPQRVSYEALLRVYWRNIDPFDDRGQFCDKGPSYRSAIFVATAQQRRLAEASRQVVVERFPDLEVVTPVRDAGPFYPVKEYHQDYYRKNPLRYLFYKTTCGRPARLEEIWGESAVH
ncbi:MAG: peptide-methionine (S)-S-oxide reductase MsrA [Oceanospirillaceae bacterium]|nr:peptide-methionine (S)-S-oxide reductase MsrA [Oceanospirillaceae bacterium]